jgi:hypothetical protein
MGLPILNEYLLEVPQSGTIPPVPYGPPHEYDEGFCMHGRSMVLNLALVTNGQSCLESFQEFHKIAKCNLQIVPELILLRYREMSAFEHRGPVVVIILFIGNNAPLHAFHCCLNNLRGRCIIVRVIIGFRRCELSQMTQGDGKFMPRYSITFEIKGKTKLSNELDPKGDVMTTNNFFPHKLEI